MLGTVWHCGRHAPLPFGRNVFPSRHHGSTADSEEFDARPVRAFVPGPGLQVDESVNDEGFYLMDEPDAPLSGRISGTCSEAPAAEGTP
jgi:hypothetical protein